MPHYRLYCIDQAGRFFSCDEIDAPDDAAAARRALELRGDHAAELWSGARHVTTFRAATPPAAAAAAG